MRSPTCALLWEIWQRRRFTAAAVIALTAAGRVLDFAERAARNGPADHSSLVELLCWFSFVFLFGVFTYTDSDGTRAVGHFPRRLFTLPVSSLRLVAVPMVAGIASVELLFLLWIEPLTRGGSTSPLLIAVLLAAMVVFYLAAIWTLERLGALRLFVVGAIAVIVIGAGLIPSFPPAPPPPWRSQATVGAVTAALAVMAFLIAWRHIVRLRGGGGQTFDRFTLFTALANVAMPRTQKAFPSPAAAHFWFEWRCSGRVLPLLVGGVLLVIVTPMSWFVRNDGGDSVQLLFAILATPIVVAIPVGMAFGKPTFWSEDLSLPAFVAVRPLTDEAIVATKVKVAAASTVLSWVLVLSFIGVWSWWANLDAMSRLAIQLWAFHGQSVAAVYGIATLVVIAGGLLTWRFMVIRMWSGMSGSRPLFVASVMSVVIAAIAWMVVDGTRLPGLVLEDPGRMTALAWALAIAVIAKYWLAAYSCRRTSSSFARISLLIWGAGTACFLALALALWGVVRIYVALDVYRFQAVMMLAALLAMPLGRVELAPSRLTRNRHR